MKVQRMTCALDGVLGDDSFEKSEQGFWTELVDGSFVEASIVCVLKLLKVLSVYCFCWVREIILGRR